jgi:hypothetical protein
VHLFRSSDGLTLALHNSGLRGPALAAGWFVPDGTLGLALDLDTGETLISVNGKEWKTVYKAAGVSAAKPSGAVGACLFPAISGMKGARAQCKWGAKDGQAMKYTAPSSIYQTVGAAMQAQV